MLRKGETGGWKTAEAWPVPGVGHQELALRADGILGTDEGEPGECTYMSLGAGLNRAQASEVDPPAQPAWTTEPFSTDLDVLGYLELRLDATASAADTAWIVTLQDIAPDSSATDVTAGYLRASQRAVDEAASEPGQPSLPNRSAEAVPINKPVSYRVPIVGTGYRFAAGYQLRLVLTSDDQDPRFPAVMLFRHASVGTSSLNRIASSSRLLVPVAVGKL